LLLLQIESIMAEKSSTKWDDNLRSILITCLLEKLKEGDCLLKLKGSEKSNLYTEVTTLFQEKAKVAYSRDQLQTCVSALKKTYNTFKEMTKLSGFGWDREKNTVSTENETVLAEYIKAHSEAAGLDKKPPVRYEDLQQLFEDGKRAVGNYAVTITSSHHHHHYQHPVSSSSSSSSLSRPATIASTFGTRRSWRTAANTDASVSSEETDIDGTATSTARKRRKRGRPDDHAVTAAIDRLAATQSKRTAFEIACDHYAEQFADNDTDLSLDVKEYFMANPPQALLFNSCSRAERALYMQRLIKRDSKFERYRID